MGGCGEIYRMVTELHSTESISNDQIKRAFNIDTDIQIK